MQPRLFVLLAVSTMPGLLGCASTRLQPGTGDIAFRLIWSGTDDLDLHVEDPKGHQLHFLQRECEGGGMLDIDCNAAPGEICRRPIENVFWPEGKAPAGVYRYAAVLFNASEGTVAVDYTLQVLLGETVAHEETGRLTPDDRASMTFEYRIEKVPSH
mgnify:CR=1 FL=1